MRAGPLDGLEGFLLLRSVGGASALALARVLAFTAVVAGLASALAFTGILAGAAMLLALLVSEGHARVVGG